ncbi:carboxypeptidase regulatory-like domain-containing protein [Myxococcus sp. SDU36]|uniref:MSCRAMM family protein n=1 Tax=Myxococcus sp. SDU36 TaxID=2831967 RepID=UPI00254378B6|nr:carboxypeptidase regulatory-like domain-containing protein [Myxococcus sp. SDU36]
MKRFLMWAIGVVVVVVGFLVGQRFSAAPPTQGSPPAAPPGNRVVVRTDTSSAAGPRGRGGGPGEAASLPVVPDADDPGTLQLQGLVLDAQELPVPGALVRLDSASVSPVRTGQDGTFLFTGLPARAFQIEALHEGAMAGPVSFWLRERTEPLVLHLLPTASLRVDVVDQGARRPLPGAQVEVRVPQPRIEQTDASGRALVKALPSGRHTLRVTAEGFAPVWRVVQVGAASAVPQQLTVELRAGAAVSGTVVDARGAPVPGARITPAPQARSLLPLTDARWDGVVADAEGRWRVDSLEPGLYRFTASGSRHAPGTSAPVRVEDTRPVDGVVVAMGDAARLAGTVVDGNGDPMPGAVVRVVLDEGLGRTLARQASVDARGAFQMEDLPRRRVAVAAVHDAASSSTRYVDLAQDGAGSAVELVLDATGVVRGRVEFASGEPVGEAVIMAEPASALARGRVEGTLRGRHVAVADPGGRFEVRGLVHGTYNLRAAAPGTPPHQRVAWMGAPVRAETGGSEVVVRMRRGGSLSGQVRLEDGAAPAAFTVTLRGGAGTSFGGGDGRFQVNGIPAGEYTVFVSGPGFLTKSLPALKVEEDQDTNLGAVVLSRGRRLTGRVVSAAGAPVQGATVTVSQQLRGSAVVVGSAAELEHGLQQARSDAEGRFVLEGLPISILQLGAEHPVEGRSAFVRVEEGVQDRTLEVKLSAVGHLEGTVRRGTEPVSGALVVVTSPGAPSGGTSSATGTDGGFQFDSLTPGTYTVLAVVDSGAGQQVERATVTLRPAERARVDLELPRGEVTLLVRAQPAPQGPSADAARAILLAQGQPGTQASPSQVQTLTLSEPARFASVVPGSYQVCVSAAPVSGTQGTDAGSPSPAQCQPVRVSLSPAEQLMMVTMPAP